MARLTAAVLAAKGTQCHLCSTGPDDPIGEGADSPDHDPPRHDLERMGVLDPDALRWLWPSHYRCNVRRKRAPVTPDLRAYLRERRLDDLGLSPSVTAARLSPALAARRPAPSFESR